MPEPISLEEAKLYCRISSNDEDATITALIQAAREAAEAKCRRGMGVEFWPSGYPEPVRVWMLIWISTQFENREAYADAKLFKLNHVDRLLDPYVIPGLA